MTGDLANNEASWRNAADTALSHLDDVLRYSFARLGSREEAEDVTMEVFHAVHAQGRKLLKAADIRLYLIGMARRKVADSLRRKSRQRQTTEPQHPTTETATNPETLDRNRAVAQTLDRLPDPQREALIFKYVHGFTTEEIGKLTRKSPQAVNSLLQRARANFQREGTEFFAGGST